MTSPCPFSRLRVFQSGITPFVTAVHAAVDTTLFRAALLHPVYAVGGAALLLAGWSVQLALWLFCYSHGPFRSSWTCPGGPLAWSLYWVRIAFAAALLALYLAHLVLAAMATHRWRRQRKQVQRL